MYKIYPRTEEEAARLAEDYEYLGYNTSIEDNVLSVWKGHKRRVKPEKKRLDKRTRD